VRGVFKRSGKVFPARNRRLLVFDSINHSVKNNTNVLSEQKTEAFSNGKKGDFVVDLHSHTSVKG